MKYLLVIYVALLTGWQSYAATLSSSDIQAKAYILIEADSERVLTQYRATERLSPASITKLMTAYVVYKSIASGLLSLDDSTVISAEARAMTEGSRMFIEQGSRVTIAELLHGLVVQSGNDAAVALAEAVAGSEQAFVELMNQAAAALAMTDSHFKNVTGLTQEGHYMSAHNIAILARAIIKQFPEHYRLYKEKSFTWNGIKQANRNTLLKTDPTVDGLKTGYTEAAGYCLTVSAKRHDMRLISVVLGTKSKAARVRASEKMLDYGFSNYRLQTFYRADQVITRINVKNGKQDNIAVASTDDVILPVTAQEATQINARLVVDASLAAPLAGGQQVGHFEIRLADQVLLTVPAKILSSVEEIGLLQRFWRYLMAVISDFFVTLWQFIKQTVSAWF